MSSFAQSNPNAISAASTRDATIATVLGQWAIAFLFFVSIVAPVVVIGSGLPWLRVEQITLFPIALIYLWLLMVGSATPLRMNSLVIAAAIYSICILLSLFYGTAILGHQFLYRDLYEFPKAWLPVVFFTIGLDCYLSEKAMRRVLVFFLAGVFLACLYAWAQWFDLGITHWLSQFYSGGAHDEGALSHYRRVYSTMGNPNILAQLLTWAIAACALAVLSGVGSRLVNLLMISACLVTLAMTGSRYGLIDTGLALLVICFLSASVKSRRRSSLALLGIFLLVSVCITVVVASSNQATLDRVESLRDPIQTDSLRGRLDELWPDAEHDFFESPLFGHGPAKVIFSDIVTDSEYLDVLKQFGVIGFIAYFAYYIYVLRNLLRGLKCRTRSSDWEFRFPAASWALQLAFVILTTGLVMNIGMSTFYSEPLQAFFWLWLGIGVNMSRRTGVAE